MVELIICDGFLSFHIQAIHKELFAREKYGIMSLYPFIVEWEITAVFYEEGVGITP